MNKKVKAFFHVFLNSLLPHFSYYHKILKTRFSFSAKYFLSLILIFNLIFILVISFKFNPLVIKNLFFNINQSLSNYPDNFVINIKGGRLISNFNRPYFFWLKKDEKVKLLLVVDESATPEKINQYNSFILLTSSNLVTKKSPFSKQFIVSPLNSFNNINIDKIDKKRVESLQEIFLKLTRWLPIWYFLGLIILLLILPLFSLIITGFYLIFSAFIIFLVAKIATKKNYHFKKILQIGLHAATLPLLIDYFLLIFQPSIKWGINLPIKPIPFPFLFLILLIIFVSAGVYEAYYHHHSPSMLKLPHERRTKNSD